MALILPNYGTYVNYGRGFFSSAFLNKNLSQILKIHSHFPGIPSEDEVVKLAKKMVLFGRVVLEG
jgi:hypothetical protein